jgi:hypothetical protein
MAADRDDIAVDVEPDLLAAKPDPLLGRLRVDCVGGDRQQRDSSNQCTGVARSHGRAPNIGGMKIESGARLAEQ